MQRLKHLSRLAALAAALAALAWQPSQAADEVTVGALLPLSGVTGPNGQAVLDGMTMAADDINAKGGLLSRQIKVIAKDDESTPAIGVSRANELVADGVSAVMGGWNSTVTLAVQPILARAEIIDITAVAKADAVLDAGGNPYAIRINSSNSQDGNIVARYVLEKLGAKRVAFMTQNDTYGEGAQKVIETEMTKLGKPYEVVVTEKFPFKQMDFRVALTNVKSANPDAVIVINGSQSAGMPALIQQYVEAGITAQFVGSVGGLLDTVFPIAGAAVNGMVTADVYIPDLPPYSEIEANNAFVKAYEAKYGKKPQKMAALGYAAMQVWAKGVEKAGDFDRVKVAEAIRGHKIDGTIFGDVTFSEQGQMAAKLVLYKVTDYATGKLEPITLD